MIVEFLTGDAVAAGAYYEIAIEAFREQGEYSLNYVRALQAWGSLEAQARNSTRARSLFLESIRMARKVIVLVHFFSLHKEGVLTSILQSI